MAKSKPQHFFKIFFPEQSTECLRIPPGFWGQIEVECSKKAYLKSRSGNSWKVSLVKKSDGFVFEDGWKEFVGDHSLVMGDFLLFRYNGNLRFEVFVFDSTACEKKKAFVARSSVIEEIEDVEEGEKLKEEMNLIEEDDENRPLVHFTKRRFDGGLKKKRWINEGDQLNLIGSKSSSSDQKDLLSPMSVELLTPKQEYESYSDRDAKIHKKEESMQRKSGQVSGCSPNSVKKSPSDKYINSQQLARTDESSLRRGSVFRVGSYISQRRPVTEEEVERTLQRAMSFKSENPFAVAIMQDSYVYTSFFMCVPSWFAKKHLPKENTILTVWSPNGQPWKITYICYSTHGALSGGWSKFSFAHNLEKYDVCVFELIKTNNLKVHIYRVVEEIAPLIRRRRGIDN